MAVDPLEGAQRPLGRRRDRADGLVPGVEGLAGGEPGRFAPGPDGGRLTAGELFGQQCLHRFGRFPALCLGGGQQVRRGDTHVGQAQGAQQVDGLVDRGLVHRSPPRRPQAAVEGCNEWSSPAVWRSPTGCAARIDARSPSAKRA